MVFTLCVNLLFLGLEMCKKRIMELEMAEFHINVADAGKSIFLSSCSSTETPLMVRVKKRI